MAFMQSDRPPQLIDFMNQFPGDCRHPLTSSSDNAPVTESLFIDYSAMPISFCPPQDPPKNPVHKKKRTSGQVDANEQFQIVCCDALATQPTEPQKKKKRKITPKIKSGPVVTNEVTERLQKFITGDEMNGSELKLVIQKVLYLSDLKHDQNRLILPFKQLQTEDFLTTEEKLRLANNEDMEVRLVGPTLQMYKEPMKVTIWKMKSTSNLVFKTNWYSFVKENEEYLKEYSKIQLWSFRKEQQLCFALAVVARPPDGINAPVTESLFIDYSAMPISFCPPQDPPKNTNKKKRTRGQVDANKQFQIVCCDALATQPEKKKRKITPRIKPGPVVKNEVTEKLQKFITGDKMNGSELKLVIQKVLYMSDLKHDKNRLNLPLKQLQTEDFLTTEEKLRLANKEAMEVRLVGPTLQMYKEPMKLTIWNMNKDNSNNLVLKTNWYRFVKENEEYLREYSKIQLWSFRKEQKLCLALAVVAGPPDGINSVAN